MPPQTGPLPEGPDRYKHFARLLLDGKVVSGFEVLAPWLNDRPSLVLRTWATPKVSRLLAALQGEPVRRSPSTGRIVLVLGGARSGKSRLAERLAEDHGGNAVTYIATAEVRDEEMAERVAQHRQDRPSTWQTIEEPRHVAAALAKAEHATVLLDCLTLLSTNLLLGSDEQTAHEEIDRMVDVALHRRGTLIVVSNEVGNGIVPVNALARQFRDLQGVLNRRIAEAADTVLLVVAGQSLTLKGS